MGADKAVHLLDDGMRGSDVIQTGWALARALGTIEGTELVIAGNESTDGAGARCRRSSPSTSACRS